MDIECTQGIVKPIVGNVQEHQDEHIILKVIFLNGSSPDMCFELKNGDNLIGRSKQCDIVIPSAVVSNMHAVVEVVSGADGCHISDKGSTNGTRIGTRSLTKDVKYFVGMNEPFILGEVLSCTVQRDDKIHGVSDSDSTVSESMLLNDQVFDVIEDETKKLNSPSVKYHEESSFENNDNVLNKSNDLSNAKEDTANLHFISTLNNNATVGEAISENSNSTHASDDLLASEALEVEQSYIKSQEENLSHKLADTSVDCRVVNNKVNDLEIQHSKKEPVLFSQLSAQSGFERVQIPDLNFTQRENQDELLCPSTQDDCMRRGQPDEIDSEIGETPPASPDCVPGSSSEPEDVLTALHVSLAGSDHRVSVGSSKASLTLNLSNTADEMFVAESEFQGVKVADTICVPNMDVPNILDAGEGDVPETEECIGAHEKDSHIDAGSGDALNGVVSDSESDANEIASPVVNTCTTPVENLYGVTPLEADSPLDGVYQYNITNESVISDSLPQISFLSKHKSLVDNNATFESSVRSEKIEINDDADNESVSEKFDDNVANFLRKAPEECGDKVTCVDLSQTRSSDDSEKVCSPTQHVSGEMRAAFHKAVSDYEHESKSEHSDNGDKSQNTVIELNSTNNKLTDSNGVVETAKLTDVSFNDSGACSPTQVVSSELIDRFKKSAEEHMLERDNSENAVTLDANQKTECTKSEEAVSESSSQSREGQTQVAKSKKSEISQHMKGNGQLIAPEVSLEHQPENGSTNQVLDNIAVAQENIEVVLNDGKKVFVPTADRSDTHKVGFEAVVNEGDSISEATTKSISDNAQTGMFAGNEHDASPTARVTEWLKGVQGCEDVDEIPTQVCKSPKRKSALSTNDSNVTNVRRSGRQMKPSKKLLNFEAGKTLATRSRSSDKTFKVPDVPMQTNDQLEKTAPVPQTSRKKNKKNTDVQDQAQQSTAELDVIQSQMNSQFASVLSLVRPSKIQKKEQDGRRLTRARANVKNSARKTQSSSNVELDSVPSKNSSADNGSKRVRATRIAKAVVLTDNSNVEDIGDKSVLLHLDANVAPERALRKTTHLNKNDDTVSRIEVKKELRSSTSSTEEQEARTLRKNRDRVLSLNSNIKKKVARSSSCVAEPINVVEQRALRPKKDVGDVAKGKTAQRAVRCSRQRVDRKAGEVETITVKSEVASSDTALTAAAVDQDKSNIDSKRATRSRNNSKLSDTNDASLVSAECKPTRASKTVNKRSVVAVTDSKEMSCDRNTRTTRMRSEVANIVGETSAIIEKEAIKPKVSSTKRKQTAVEPSSSQKKRRSLTNGVTSVRESGRRTTSTSTDDSVSVLNCSWMSNMSESSRLRRAKLRLLFTGIEEKDINKIKRIGCFKTDVFHEANVLVSDKFYRTLKMMYCIAKGIPVVHTSWLDDSNKAGAPLDVDGYVLRDELAEKQYRFEMPIALKKSRDSPLFTGWNVYVTKHCKPSPDQMKEIIQAAGGRFLSVYPKQCGENTVIVSCAEDFDKIPSSVSQMGIPVVSNEFILTGLLRHRIDLKSFKL